MRHLWSLLAGVIAAPLVWGLVALGQSGSQDTIGGWVREGSFDSADLVEPAAYLAVAGVLLGLVAALRISPLGPLVAGLLLAGPYLAMFAAPLDVRDAVPDDWEILDRELPLRLPLDNGTLLLLGALLLMAVFSAQRWRRWPAAPAAMPAETPGEATAPAEQEPETEPIHVPAEPGLPPSWPMPQAGAPPESSPPRPAPPAESPWSLPPRQGRDDT